MNKKLNAENELIENIAKYEKISGVFWLILGIIQICAVATIVAGIWNVYAFFTRRGLPNRIRARDKAIPEEYEGITQLVIVAIVNAFLGGVVGLAFVAFDFYVRKNVLANRELFTTDLECVDSAELAISGSESNNNDGNTLESKLRSLAKLRDDKIITDEEFEQQKGTLFKTQILNT